MGAIFSRKGKGEDDFEITIGQPDYNSFQKVTDASMIKDYLKPNAHGSIAKPLPPTPRQELPPTPRGEKADSKKSSLDDDEILTEEGSSNVVPARQQQEQNDREEGVETTPQHAEALDNDETNEGEEH
jgi:hypothetical protein